MLLVNLMMLLRLLLILQTFKICLTIKVLEHYYLSIGAESLWNARELIMKAIREQNKLINEDYNEKFKDTSKEAIKDKG